MWNNKHRERLYRIIESRWADLELNAWEDWLQSFGIKWAELEYEGDAPEGTIAVHEGPGFKDQNLKMCWVIPDDVALKLMTLL